MKTISYEVTSMNSGICKVMSYHAVRVMINSNSREKTVENFKKLDDLEINDAIAMNDNYGAFGGGEVVIERVS